MLKIISGALIISTALISPAKADPEVVRRCGTQLTWTGAKCAWNLKGARDSEIEAAGYEIRAKHAEIDGKPDEAEGYRRMAEFLRLKADATRRLYPLPK